MFSACMCTSCVQMHAVAKGGDQISVTGVKDGCDYHGGVEN